MDRVAIVVLNYKRINDTVSCIETLLKQTHHNFTIIAIDNGSRDGSVEVLKELQVKHSKKLYTIFNRINKGFDGGVNTGIKWALSKNYDYIALLNNDALPEDTWLENLVAAAKENDAGITTGLLLHEDGKTIDSTGDYYSIWGLAFPRGRDQPTKSAPEAGLVFGASGGASLYSANLFHDIGIFDEPFFAYYEDVDISFRAQLAGYVVYYEPRAIAYHQQGATSSSMPGFAIYQTFKNLPLLFIKNVPKSLLLSVGSRFCLAYTLMLGRAIIRGDGWPALKGGVRGFVLFWTHGLAQRRIIQQAKRVDDEYIKSILWHDLPPEQTGLRKLRRIFTGR